MNTLPGKAKMTRPHWATKELSCPYFIALPCKSARLGDLPHATGEKTELRWTRGGMCHSWSSPGALMWRAESFEKTLMLGKVEGGRRRGQQKMRWLDGITDSMHMSFGKLRGGQGGLACCSSWGHKKTDMTERLNGTELYCTPNTWGWYLGHSWSSGNSSFYLITNYLSCTFGCAGSRLLRSFLQSWGRGLPFTCSAWASHPVASPVAGYWLQVCRLRQLWLWSSVAAVPGLWCTGSVIVAHGLSCSAECGIVPHQGSNLKLVCPALAGKFFFYHWATKEAWQVNF